jgi:hypothetical protein
MLVRYAMLCFIYSDLFRWTPLLFLTKCFQGQDELFTHDGNSYELFGKLPEVDVESSEWTEALATDGTSLVYQNLQKLDSFLSSQVSISIFLR